jgi:tRNA(Ile)-lysidine synthase
MNGCKAMAVLPTPKPTPANRAVAAPTAGADAAYPGPASAPAFDFVNPALAALQCLQGLSLPVCVAYSGGADSTALLLAALRCWPGQVQAIHIHHGLQAAADEFVRVCDSVCAGRQIPLLVVPVDASHAPGESPEDAARRARYAALAAAAAQKGLGAVLLGQHADDQVETLLLALSRGAGLPGLSAMPAQFERGGLMFYRPLLKIPSVVLREWLIKQQVPFVDDPTNLDERYTRNRIRARLLPALAEAFPQFRITFARSARHAAQAQALLLEVAQQDLLRVGLPPAIKELQALSPPRQANLLRHWLARQHATPSTAQLDQLMAQVMACRTRGQQIHLKVARGHVRRVGMVLHYSAGSSKSIDQIDAPV